MTALLWIGRAGWVTWAVARRLWRRPELALALALIYAIAVTLDRFVG